VEEKSNPDLSGNVQSAAGGPMAEIKEILNAEKSQSTPNGGHGPEPPSLKQGANEKIRITLIAMRSVPGTLKTPILWDSTLPG